MKDSTAETLVVGGFSLGGIIVLAAIVFLAMWGCPQYKVYSQRMDGEAELAQAQYNSKVVVAEANAKFDAAKSLAGADTERARGVAASNRIIGQSLEKNDKYLNWLWIESLKEGKNDVIYIPTEANIPIMEANRQLIRPSKDSTK